MKLPLLLSLVFALLLPATLSYASESELIAASYEVPVTEDLMHLAQFELTDLRVKTTDGLTRMEYTLPRELTGRSIKMKFVGDGSSYSGPLGEATCAGLDCAVRYPRLDIVESEVRQFLVSKGFKDRELSQRLLVARSFRESDPGGFIHMRYNRKAR